MSYSEMKSLDDVKLQEKLDSVNNELLSLKIQLNTGRLTAKHLISTARKKIAQIKTLQAERKSQGVEDDR